MIEKLLSSLIPVVSRQLASVSMADKKAVAAEIMAICWAFAQGDRPVFDDHLARLSLPGDWKQLLVEALWREDPSK